MTPVTLTTTDRLRALPASLDAMARAKRAKAETMAGPKTGSYGRASRLRDVEALELTHRAMLVAARFPVGFSNFYRAMMGEAL